MRLKRQSGYLRHQYAILSMSTKPTVKNVTPESRWAVTYVDFECQTRESFSKILICQYITRQSAPSFFTRVWRKPRRNVLQKHSFKDLFVVEISN